MESSLPVRCAPKAQYLLVLQQDQWSERGLKAAFVLSDSKSKGWEKIRNINLVSFSQICEETRRIQDPVEFTGT